jgi:hypothetical protein
MRILMVIGNAAIYDSTCYFVMSLGNCWQA